MTSHVRRSIAVYEVLTFLGALLDIVAAIFASRSRPPGFYIVAAIALLAAGMSLLAGVRLWNDRPGARRLSIIVQLFQIPHVAIEGVVAYTVALGLSIIIRMGHEPEVMRPPVHLFLHLGTGTLSESISWRRPLPFSFCDGSQRQLARPHLLPKPNLSPDRSPMRRQPNVRCT